MAAPNLTIAVEPTESSSVVYGQLAARSSQDAPEGQLSLALAITNNEATGVHLNQVTISFVPSVAVPDSTIAANLNIASTTTAYWWFNETDNIILPEPAPTAIKISLACANFSAPAVANFPLAPHKGPAIGGYLFPAKTDDLQKTEFWFGVSAQHRPGGLGTPGTFAAGTQLFAYDMVVRGFDDSSQQWTEALSGTTGSKNKDVRTWGKRIYAMAAGSVVQFKNNMPDNTTFGTQSPTPNPVEGNHFYIQHGPDLALYAHFQMGSLNSDLLSIGAVVSEGQFLGLAGNSGNSTGPHLHMHVIRATAPWGGPPRPLPFRNMHVLDGARVFPRPWPPDSDAPWTKVDGQDLPSVMSAIWPGPLGFGRRRFFMALAWAWLIFIGGLMITPGGIECIACGPVWTRVLGVVSIGLGILGFVVSRLRALGKAAAGIEAKGDMHG